jgi:hypothetical protein
MVALPQVMRRLHLRLLFVVLCQIGCSQSRRKHAS